MSLSIVFTFLAVRTLIIYQLICTDYSVQQDMARRGVAGRTILPAMVIKETTAPPTTSRRHVVIANVWETTFPPGKNPEWADSHFGMSNYHIVKN